MNPCCFINLINSNFTSAVFSWQINTTKYSLQTSQMLLVLWVKERIEILTDMSESLECQSVVQGNVILSDGFSLSLLGFFWREYMLGRRIPDL